MATMDDEQRRIATTLSSAARVLPPEDRRAFRAFLAKQAGPKHRRKVHSWHRKRAKKAAPSKPPPSRQLKLL